LIYSSAVNRRINETRKKRSIEAQRMNNGGPDHHEIVHRKQRSNEEQQRNHKLLTGIGILDTVVVNNTSNSHQQQNNHSRLRNISCSPPKITTINTFRCLEKTCSGGESPTTYKKDQQFKHRPANRSEKINNELHIRKTATVTNSFTVQAPDAVRRKVSTPTIICQEKANPEDVQQYMPPPMKGPSLKKLLFEKRMARIGHSNELIVVSENCSKDSSEESPEVPPESGTLVPILNNKNKPRRRSVSMDAAVNSWKTRVVDQSDLKVGPLQKMRIRFNRWKLSS